MAIKGIDVSTHNGTIDWSQVSKAGYEFAFIRSSYGLRSRDSKFKTNATAAAARRIHVGAYHYSYATSAADAKTEAKNFLAAIKGYKLTYPVVYDLEYNDKTKLALSRWTDLAIAFLDTMEKAGYFAMLYSDRNSLQHYFDHKRIARYAVWLAAWTNSPGYSESFGVWQYSNQGSVPGIKGNVDLDTSYADYATIIQHAGLNKG